MVYMRKKEAKMVKRLAHLGYAVFGVWLIWGQRRSDLLTQDGVPQMGRCGIVEDGDPSARVSLFDIITVMYACLGKPMNEKGKTGISTTQPFCSQTPAVLSKL